MAQFTIKSGRVNLSDPCYDADTWCGAYSIPAINGQWNVDLKYSCGRVAYWSAWVSNKPKSVKTESIDFGVDSGQFGIFDSSIYDPDGKFYGRCCDITLARDQSGSVIDDNEESLGFVSSSGYGDGKYEGTLYFSKQNELIGFEIAFIEEEEEE